MQFGCKECNKLAWETIKFTTIGVFCGWGCYKKFRKRFKPFNVVKSYTGEMAMNAWLNYFDWYEKHNAI